MNFQMKPMAIAGILLMLTTSCGERDGYSLTDALNNPTNESDPIFMKVFVGASHTCALSPLTGNVRCWGTGNDGRLGYGNTNTIGDDEVPSTAGDVDLGGDVIAIATGTFSGHTCALLTTGNVRCWGLGANGQLGYGNTNDIGDDETPASAGDVNIGGTVTQIAVGSQHTCVLLSTGNVRCWGNGSNGRLGYANVTTIGDDEAPASAGDVPVGGTVVQIGAGSTHTCALLSTGNVRCWGFGSFGILGYGNTTHIGDDETPASAGDVNIGGTVTQIAVGGQHTCALLSTGDVRCWGIATGGRLGYGNFNNVGDDETPASAGNVNVGGTVTQIAAGGNFTCALLTTGNVRCWGSGAFGKLGYGNTTTIGDDELPSTVGYVDVGDRVVQIASGSSHTCVVLSTNQLRCWGLGTSGQLGYGNTTTIGDDEVPSTVGTVNVF